MTPTLATIGRWIFLSGLVITLVGGLIWLAARITGWDKFPGTLRFQTGSLTCVVPILGSILLSVILTILLNLAARFFNR